jgi:hypothetical protein
VPTSSSNSSSSSASSSSPIRRCFAYLEEAEAEVEAIASNSDRAAGWRRKEEDSFPRSPSDRRRGGEGAWGGSGGARCVDRCRLVDRNPEGFSVRTWWWYRTLVARRVLETWARGIGTYQWRTWTMSRHIGRIDAMLSALAQRGCGLPP